MLLKTVSDGERVFEIRLDTRTDAVSITNINREGEEGESLTFATPHEMSKVGTALVGMSVRWRSFHDPQQ